jgi:hypothetical protein
VVKDSGRLRAQRLTTWGHDLRLAQAVTARAADHRGAACATSSWNGRCATPRRSWAATSTTPTCCSSGLANYKLAMSMQEYTANLQFADPLLQLGVPKLLTGLDALGLYASGAHYVSGLDPAAGDAPALLRRWTRFVLGKAMAKATVVVAPVHELDDFGLEELAGKTVITSNVNDERLARFKDKGVNMVVDGSPGAATAMCWARRCWTR